MDDSIDPGEALLAVTGIARILERKPRRPTLAEHHEASRVGDRIRSACREFITEEGFTRRPRGSDVEVDYEKARDELAPPPDPSDLELITAPFPPAQNALAISYGTAAGRVYEWLRGRLPRDVDLPTFAGARIEQPSPLEREDFRRDYTIAERPLSVLDHLRQGLLSGDEMEALEQAYPTIAATLVAELQMAIFERQANHPRWELDDAKENLAESVLGVSQFGAELAIDLQKRLALAAEEAKDAAPAARSRAAEQLNTPIQRSERS